MAWRRSPGIASAVGGGDEHIRDVLTASGHDASGAYLGLFSTAGFTDELHAEAAKPGRRVLVAGLDRLYGQGSTVNVTTLSRLAVASDWAHKLQGASVGDRRTCLGTDHRLRDVFHPPICAPGDAGRHFLNTA